MKKERSVLSYVWSFLSVPVRLISTISELMWTLIFCTYLSAYSSLKVWSSLLLFICLYLQSFNLALIRYFGTTSTDHCQISTFDKTTKYLVRNSNRDIIANQINIDLQKLERIKVQLDFCYFEHFQDTYHKKISMVFHGNMLDLPPTKHNRKAMSYAKLSPIIELVTEIGRPKIECWVPRGGTWTTDCGFPYNECHPRTMLLPHMHFVYESK